MDETFFFVRIGTLSVLFFNCHLPVRREDSLGRRKKSRYKEIKGLTRFVCFYFSLLIVSNDSTRLRRVLLAIGDAQSRSNSVTVANCRWLSRYIFRRTK